MTQSDALKLEASNVSNKRTAMAVIAALGKEMTEEEAVVYAARRLLALAKDQARKKAGKLASRLYSPALDDVDEENIPPALDAAVDTIGDVQADLANGRAVKSAGKPRKGKAAKEG
jgi:hypothetical protein